MYASLGCRGCHIVGTGGGYVGPDLGDTANRLKPGWIQAWLLSPQKWKAGTLQPDYALKADQARDLTAYLMTLRKVASGRKP